jgi:hypothetical protein
MCIRSDRSLIHTRAFAQIGAGTSMLRNRATNKASPVQNRTCKISSEPTNAEEQVSKSANDQNEATLPEPKHSHQASKDSETNGRKNSARRSLGFNAISGQVGTSNTCVYLHCILGREIFLHRTYVTWPRGR